MNRTEFSLLGSSVALLVATSTALASGENGSVSPARVLMKAQANAQGAGGYAGYGGFENSASSEEFERSQAPYFQVAGSSKETLPLKETRARVNIAGVIARVKVHQVFENHSAKPIEALYVFPASTRAAVHGMRMRIGERTVEAKIERRETARKTYEAAKQAGQRASLLEQERPNVFTMNVANVMPKDRIEVELEYSELLVPDSKTYEFVYPTVVGPRYQDARPSPTLAEGVAEPYRFDIQVHLETGISLKALTSPSHDVQVSYAHPHSADVTLTRPGGGNKDFVLRYRLAGDAIESGLLLSPLDAQGEGFFTLMVEPPQRPATRMIPPREYVFVLDVSGSMHGFPLNTAKGLMKSLLTSLRPTDTFNVVLFSGAAYVMNPQGSVSASPENVQRALELIGRENGGGGTELLGALRSAYGIPKKEITVSRSVVVVTDGYVGVEAESFQFIRERLNESNLFAFGIGSSVNRGLIEGMARAGQGEPFVVLKPDAAATEANKLSQYISQPLLSGIQFRFQGFDAYDVAPAKLPDLMAERPLVLFGKYRGSVNGHIALTGSTGTGPFTRVVEVQPAAVQPSNDVLRWLWARKWVEVLDDQHHLTQSAEISEAITNLGFAYHLLTRLTSFVAVDSQRVNSDGAQETVLQPLPLPEGVSNLAGVKADGSGAGGLGNGAVQMPVAPAPLAIRRSAELQSTSLAPAEAVATKARGEDGNKLKKEDASTKPGRTAARVTVQAQRAVSKMDALLIVDELKALLSQGCAQSGEGSVVLEWDAQGNIHRLEVQSATHAGAAWKQCVETLVQAWAKKRVGKAGGMLTVWVKLAS